MERGSGKLVRRLFLNGVCDYLRLGIARGDDDGRSVWIVSDRCQANRDDEPAS